MTESEQIVCAVATANGFAMPIVASVAAPAKDNEACRDDPYRQFLRLWFASLRLLQGQFFLM